MRDIANNTLNLEFEVTLPNFKLAVLRKAEWSQPKYPNILATIVTIFNIKLTRRKRKKSLDTNLWNFIFPNILTKMSFRIKHNELFCRENSTKFFIVTTMSSHSFFFFSCNIMLHLFQNVDTVLKVWISHFYALTYISKLHCTKWKEN